MAQDFKNYEPIFSNNSKVRETEKAVLIRFKFHPTGYVEDAFDAEKWFPKSQVFQNQYGVWCAPDWLIQKVRKEITPDYAK